MKQKCKYWWTAFYFPVYMALFVLLEKYGSSRIHLIGVPLDERIPFCEEFIVPYLLWFPYILIVFLIFFFSDKKEYLQMVAFLYSGMTVFLVISYFYPNGLALRPSVFPRENIFTRLVATLYATDTPTNVLPSIHVYNSIGVAIAVWRSKAVVKNKGVKWSCLLMSLCIILSTMFLKQHSVVDVAAAFILGAAVYVVVYSAASASETRARLKAKPAQN